MSQVQLINVSKFFGDVIAVDSINLMVENKSFTCLLGPSGCGKTTTLRMISGLEQPSSGEIYFDDRPVQKLSANKRDIAMVFQNYALYPHMSVYENIGFALRMMRIPDKERERRIKFASSSLGIEELLHRKPSELSGGQRQRVAVGRAIVRDSSVFLMDEPLSNLDAQLRFQMRIELKRLHEELGKTFIYVTHDQAEAMTMADKIAVIKGGQLLQYATPNQIYNNPANKFVASFIGSPPINLINCNISSNNKEIVIKFGDDSIDLQHFLDAKIDNGPVILGIRPEAVNIVSSSNNQDLRAKVLVEEPMGSDNFVVVELSNGQHLTIRTKPENYYEPGTNVCVQFIQEKILFFEIQTGDRIL